MEEVNRLVALCEEDLELLDKKTHDLVDAAALTEQMLQYANRYRHTHMKKSEKQLIKATIYSIKNITIKKH